MLLCVSMRQRRRRKVLLPTVCRVLVPDVSGVHRRWWVVYAFIRSPICCVKVCLCMDPLVRCRHQMPASSTQDRVESCY